MLSLAEPVETLLRGQGIVEVALLGEETLLVTEHVAIEGLSGRLVLNRLLQGSLAVDILKMEITPVVVGKGAFFGAFRFILGTQGHLLIIGGRRTAVEADASLQQGQPVTDDRVVPEEVLVLLDKGLDEEGRLFGHGKLRGEDLRAELP